MENVGEVLLRMFETAPKLTPTSARLLSLHHYETAFGLYDHNHNDEVRNPLALVRMHPQEDAWTGSFLVERMKQFEERNVGSRFNIGIDKFLELPRHVVLEMLNISAKREREKSKVEGDVLKTLQERASGES